MTRAPCVGLMTIDLSPNHIGKATDVLARLMFILIY